MGPEPGSRVAGGSADATTCGAEALPPWRVCGPRSRSRRGCGRTNCAGRARGRARSETRKGGIDRGRGEEGRGEKAGQEQKAGVEEKDPRRIWKGSEEDQGTQRGMEKEETTS